MNKTKLKVILGSLLVITVALLLRLKGNMDLRRNEKENIDNQRITAMTAKMIEPRVEKIIFSKSFFYSRIGTWHIRAHIVIDGKSYQLRSPEDRHLLEALQGDDGHLGGAAAHRGARRVEG